MPLGNDVVDLRHPLCQPDAIHPRFDLRAFSAREIELLAEGEEGAHSRRWSLWAAKESAFKAARQLDPAVRFLPREFAVTLNGERARVDHRSGRFDVWFDRTDQWLHALASQSSEKPAFRVRGGASGSSGSAAPGSASLQGGGPEGELEEPGRKVRRLARGALGELLRIPVDEIRIVSKDRVPRAEHRGETLPIELSLSHDGRFIACSWEVAKLQPGPSPRDGATSPTGSASPLRARETRPGSRTSRP